MRGKVLTVCLAQFFFRITPAYAGKREFPALRTSAAWDHPRLCGEKYEPGIEKSLNLGSPPPMRGKGSWEEVNERCGGITPAYAGKSRKA